MTVNISPEKLAELQSAAKLYPPFRVVNPHYSALYIEDARGRRVTGSTIDNRTVLSAGDLRAQSEREQQILAETRAAIEAACAAMNQVYGD